MRKDKRPHLLWLNLSLNMIGVIVIVIVIAIVVDAPAVCCLAAGQWPALI